MLEGLQRTFGIDPAMPFGKLPKKHRDIVLFGRPAAGRPRSARRRAEAKRIADPFGADFEGVIPNLRRRFEEGSWTDQEALEPYRALQPCPACDGERLRPESRAVRVKGRRLADYVNQPICRGACRCSNARADRARVTSIAGRVLKEIRERLRFLRRRRRRLPDARPAAPRRCRAAKGSASGWRRRSDRS